MSILLTEIFGLLKPFVDSYIKSVVNRAELDYAKNRKVRYVIEKEKSKTINELHSLIDVNEDNGLITSGNFYNFIKYNASDLIYQLLETNSYTIHNRSSEDRVKDLLVLYDTEFYDVSLYEKSLGADFIKRFFEICFRFKKNLFIALLQGDTKHILEYELNENILFNFSSAAMKKLIEILNKKKMLLQTSIEQILENEPIKVLEYLFMKNRYATLAHHLKKEALIIKLLLNSWLMQC